MRKVFACILSVAWLCVIVIGFQPVPESAEVAEGTFVFIALSIWIVTVASLVIRRRIWESSPQKVQALISACVSSIPFNAVYLLPRILVGDRGVPLVAGRDVTFGFLLVSAVVVPVAVVVAYARRQFKASTR